MIGVGSRNYAWAFLGRKCCNFEGVPVIGANDDSHVTLSGGQFEELLDELNLTPNIIPIGSVADLAVF